MKLFKRIEDDNMKLEEAKNYQNVFKSNLNEIKKQGLNHKSKKSNTKYWHAFQCTK